MQTWVSKYNSGRNLVTISEMFSMNQGSVKFAYYLNYKLGAFFFFFLKENRRRTKGVLVDTLSYLQINRTDI